MRNARLRTRDALARAALMLGVVIASLASATDAKAQTKDEERERSFRERVQPLLAKYCADCHAGDAAEGGLSFDKFKKARQILVGRNTWLGVLAKLRVKAMPPEDAEQPTDAERKFLEEWIDSAVHDIDCVRDAEPGHVTMRRLNRQEYRNTIRDLVGIDYEPTEEFPADDIGYGFDNIGDVLSLPPILMEKYLDAAEDILDQAILTTGLGLPVVMQKRADALSGGGSVRGDGQRVFPSTGAAGAEFNAPLSGQYEIIATAYGQQAGDEPAKMSLRFDGKEITVFEVKATENEPGTYKLDGRATSGKHRIELAFVNDYYNPKASDPNDRDRNLVITHLEVRGPREAKRELPATHQRILFLEPSEKQPAKEVARQILERFASRAYRRPATSDEVDRLMQLAKVAHDAGDSFEASIQLALQAVLVSPHFLFRVEAMPPAGQGERTLSDYELATRLSYFLWNSMPDDELFRHAVRGTLRKEKNLDEQVRRMLRDPKSDALVNSFAAQWLQLRKFDEMTPSKRHFPSFDEGLRRDMRRETELFFSFIVREDRSVTELLVADYTFINERLARHYGLPNVKGDRFQRVSLAGTPRGGLLTHGSILTVTSNPTRTSPVKRGRWVLENLLGEPPPPPPPNVPELIDEGKELTGTLRQQMEQHRENPNCAVCHVKMDALGFALENFDAVGAWRLFDGKHPVDATGELPNGGRFNGPAELAAYMRANMQEEFVHCMSEKMLTYALGRGLEYYDQCAVDKIVEELRQNEFRFSALILGIVQSDPFQKQGAKRSNE
ncbi:MAG: DUF1592 domain-containing protein [Planctomycetaceae bacterium]|nr:DUF1592 domain-containing protein [Planctomycetaceae bacterium]MCB9941900.1 DUF1592 domain-containing protein [Planctomycetaceae bacterium]